MESKVRELAESWYFENRNTVAPQATEDIKMLADFGSYLLQQEQPTNKEYEPYFGWCCDCREDLFDIEDKCSACEYHNQHLDICDTCDDLNDNFQPKNFNHKNKAR